MCDFFIIHAKTLKLDTGNQSRDSDWTVWIHSINQPIIPRTGLVQFPFDNYLHRYQKLMQVSYMSVICHVQDSVNLLWCSYIFITLFIWCNPTCFCWVLSSLSRGIEMLCIHGYLVTGSLNCLSAILGKIHKLHQVALLWSPFLKSHSFLQ